MAESRVAAEVDIGGREASETGFGKSIACGRRRDLGTEPLLSRFSRELMDNKR